MATNYIPDGMGAIFVTGPKWSGKATLAQTLYEALCERRGGRIEVIDTGTLITIFAQDLRNGVGDSVRNCLESGASIGDTLLKQIFCLWLEQERRRNHQLQTVIVSGGPRTATQVDLLSIFGRSLLVNLGSNKAEMFKIANEFGQTDRFEHYWNHYTKGLLPAIRHLKPSHVLHLDRTEPLKDRLDCVLSELHKNPKSPVPPEIVRAAIRRVGNPRHRIHERIAKIDPPRTTTDPLQTTQEISVTA